MEMIMEFHFSHGDLSVVEKTFQADVENVGLGWLLIYRFKLNVIKSYYVLDYGLGRVRRKLFAINQLVLQLLYQAYILSVLDYCDTLWLPSSSFGTRH